MAKRLVALLQLLPLMVQAQFPRQYAAGFYVPTSDSTRQLTGLLCLKTQQKLLVITPEGRKLHLTPAQVSRFRVGSHSYSVVRDVLVAQGSHILDVRAAFAERLDSGRINLWRYTHLWNSGSDWLFLYRYPLSFYLAAATGTRLVAIHDQGRSDAFQQQVRPLLQHRPDLVRLLDENRLTYANLPAAIRAYNTGAPFTPLSTPASE
ncbi:MAG: hypothetical protein EOO62_04470 [Hymenobacter sp.]|nr:MAG: hypothetical protein EOO62_04470 [Hymenobacter sp.]